MNYPYMGHFCELLKKHMASGLSFKTFASVIGYPPSIVNEWLVTKPEFAHTKTIGEIARIKTLEELLLVKQISLDIFKHLTEDSEAEFDGIVDGFEDSVLIQAKERFGK